MGETKLKKIERLNIIIENLENFNRCISEPVLRKTEFNIEVKRENLIVERDIKSKHSAVVALLYRAGFRNPEYDPNIFLLYEPESDISIKVETYTRHNDYYGASYGIFIKSFKKGKNAYDTAMKKLSRSW